MSKKQFFEIAEQHGIEVEYEPRSEIGQPAIVNIYSPRWKMFCTSGCHTDCSIQDLNDAGGMDWAVAVKSLKEVVGFGFDECTDPECDNCSNDDDWSEE